VVDVGDDSGRDEAPAVDEGVCLLDGADFGATLDCAAADRGAAETEGSLGGAGSRGPDSARSELAKGFPHWMQNLAFVGTCAPHNTQNMTASPALQKRWILAGPLG
jgi:hypothetical protein